MSKRDELKARIEEYLRNLRPMSSLGKWVLAKSIDSGFDRWVQSDYDLFESALKSVLRKLRKEKVVTSWGDWIHRQ